MRSTNWFAEFQSYFFITAGLAVSAVGWTAFLIPSKIVGGGITGVATLLYLSFGIDVGVMSLAMNAILILLAVRIIGTSFGAKTIYGVVMIAILLTVGQRLFHAPIVSDLFMATVIGGILAGIGGGIVFSNGGSTGGTDIVAMIINKYRNVSLGKLLLLIDAVIISTSFVVLQSIEKVVYGFMAMAILAYTVDMVITGTKQTVQIFIISRKHQELTEAIITQANRGVTILDGRGGFTGEEVKVLMVLARKRDSIHVFRIIKHIDPNAFITMGNVMGVYGKGFDTMRF
ncbi:MAG: YitT family protein [Breznakibacter sp.]